MAHSGKAVELPSGGVQTEISPIDARQGSPRLTNYRVLRTSLMLALAAGLALGVYFLVL